MKKQVWLDSVERDLLCMALNIVRMGCVDDRSGTHTRIERMCKVFVTHRVDDMLAKLGCPAEKKK